MKASLTPWSLGGGLTVTNWAVSGVAVTSPQGEEQLRAVPGSVSRGFPTGLKGGGFWGHSGRARPVRAPGPPRTCLHHDPGKVKTRTKRAVAAIACSLSGHRSPSAWLTPCLSAWKGGASASVWVPHHFRSLVCIQASVGTVTGAEPVTGWVSGPGVVALASQCAHPL